MPPKILIIDDEPSVFESLEALLANEHYYLEYAPNGTIGLEKARQLLPDVVILDLMMAGINGLDVCRQMRSNPELGEVPILMVTAFDERETKLRCLNAGVDDFLAKPFDRLELRARLRTITRLDRYRKLNQERMQLVEAYRKLEESSLQLQEAYDETIEGWSRAMDLRDHETEGHSKRVTALTLRLAQEMGIAASDLIHIQRGALLHDVGKLGIPDHILLKPGRLTNDEWDTMRQHPALAYEMLQPIKYLRLALDIPYCHHERWDGSGYPRRLEGTEIPLAARIFSIADAWDALISDRPYRLAWSTQDAYAFILSQAGQQFDPQVVSVFQDIFLEKPLHA